MPTQSIEYSQDVKTKAGAKKRILLAEDNASLLSIWNTSLTQAGYDVVAADRAHKAQELLTTTGFDLLIADIYFYHDGEIEKEGGVTLINRVRLAGTTNRDKTQPLPIVAVSGRPLARGRFKFNALPLVDNLANTTLKKPIRLDILLETVAKLI